MIPSTARCSVRLQLRHLPSLLDVVVFLSPSKKILGSYLVWATTSSFHISSNSSVILPLHTTQSRCSQDPDISHKNVPVSGEKVGRHPFCRTLRRNYYQLLDQCTRGIVSTFILVKFGGEHLKLCNVELICYT
jgi:hypothetical protein